jgi:hypothetical protein
MGHLMPIPERIIIYKKRESVMKSLWKRLTGIDKIEKETADAEAVKEAAKQAAAEALEAARIAKLSPKELATERKEPWVTVLETHVNKENIRNGFFELDWNEYFVVQLRGAGYTGDSDESIVDQWFTELCRNVGAEEGVDMSRRGSGYINVNSLGDGRSEVS